MKALSRRQFIGAFHNERGDFAFRFEGSSTRLTIPWHSIINASETVMLFGYPFLQGHLFAELFRKMQVQHAHHIFHQFASEYYGDSRACSMRFIEYQQARLDVATTDLTSAKTDFKRWLFDDVSFTLNPRVVPALVRQLLPICLLKQHERLDPAGLLYEFHVAVQMYLFPSARWGWLYATRMNLYNLIFQMVSLIVWYINKMATDGCCGAVDGRQSGDCKCDIGPGLKSQPGYILFH